jgi:hypothetical protein
MIEIREISVVFEEASDNQSVDETTEMILMKERGTISVSLIRSYVVRLPQYVENQLLGSTPTLLTFPHSLARCARNSGLPHSK